MPAYVASRIVDALNDRGLSVRGARILGLGVTYKPDVGDVRESAAIEVLAALQRRGAEIRYADPYVESVDEHGLDLAAVEITPELLADVDCVALLTPHDDFDYAALVDAGVLVFDARNALGRRDLDSVVTL